MFVDTNYQSDIFIKRIEAINRLFDQLNVDFYVFEDVLLIYLD